VKAGAPEDTTARRRRNYLGGSAVIAGLAAVAATVFWKMAVAWATPGRADFYFTTMTTEGKYAPDLLRGTIRRKFGCPEIPGRGEASSARLVAVACQTFSVRRGRASRPAANA
jgi:hypothetical protein